METQINLQESKEKMYIISESELKAFVDSISHLSYKTVVPMVGYLNSVLKEIQPLKVEQKVDK